jgi:hypothetical protein
MSSDFKTWWADYASGWTPLTTHDHEQHAERIAAFVWEHRDYREAMLRGENASLRAELAQRTAERDATNAHFLDAWRERADFARELERELAQRTAEVADLKARIDTAWADNAAHDRITDRLRAELAALKAPDPLAEMWRELGEYQPFANRDGHGESWRIMCEERTRDQAADATNPFVNRSTAARAAARAAAGAAAYFEEAMKSAADAVVAIRRAKEAKS